MPLFSIISDAPFKQGTFSQYTYPHAKAAYASLSDFLGLSQAGDSEERKVIRLIEAVEQLKADVGIPPTLREIVGADKEAAFEASLDKLAEDAVRSCQPSAAALSFPHQCTIDVADACLRSQFDDQCTGANPRYPLIKDLRGILSAAWAKPILPMASLPGAYVPRHMQQSHAAV